MIYITGDVHGDQELWQIGIAPIMNPRDIIIVAGDFGVGFFDGRYWPEEMFYDYLEKQQFTVLFIDGNHENFDKLNNYPVIKWNGGCVHRIRSNILHLIRGEIYEIEGKRLLAFGGGYSIDKAYRVPGQSWWSEEMPDSSDYDNAIRNLKRYNYQVEYIVTHTCPQETLDYMIGLGGGGIKDVVEEIPLTGFLQYIQSLTTYKGWYFGHFHLDRDLWRNQYAVFHGIREMESGKVIRYRV